MIVFLNLVLCEFGFSTFFLGNRNFISLVATINSGSDGYDWRKEISHAVWLLFLISFIQSWLFDLKRIITIGEMDSTVPITNKDNQNPPLFLNCKMLLLNFKLFAVKIHFNKQRDKIQTNTIFQELDWNTHYKKLGFQWQQKKLSMKVHFRWRLFKVATEIESETFSNDFSKLPQNIWY